MATAPVTITRDPTSHPNTAYVAQWDTLSNGDDGEAIRMSAFSDRSVQVTGTFGTGGHCKIEGSNDGVTWAVLTDPQGNDLDFTSAKLEAVEEITAYIRPNVTAGDGTTSLSVYLCISGGIPY